MKHTLLLCLLVCSSLLATAQYMTVYDSAVRYRMSPTFSVAADMLIQQAAANPADTGEGSDASQLLRWKYFMSDRISLDVAVGADMYAPMSSALSSYMTYYGDYCPGSGFTGNWNCIGPFNNYYYGTYSPLEEQGRINAIWVNPVSGTILAGSDGGGLWKSTNNGYNWHNITSGSGVGSVLGMPGVTAIAVNPWDTNTIYIATGVTSQYKKSGGYSLGLVYTTDGGATWNADAGFSSYAYYWGDPSEGAYPTIIKMAYMPGTQQLYVLTQGGNVYQLDNPAASWTNMELPVWTDGFPSASGMDFSRLVQGKVVVTTNAISYPSGSPCISNLWVMDTASPTIWTQINMPTDSVQPPGGGAIGLSVSSTDSAYIVFTTGTNAPYKVRLVKTAISAYTPRTLTTAFPPGMQDFAVSQGNDSVIYVALYGTDYGALTVSTNEGASFFHRSGNDHVDGRCLYIASASSNHMNDVVFLGTDGGVAEKGAGSSITHSITGDSLAVTEFYSLGNTEANENIIVAGAQDNGEFSYIANRAVPWNIDNTCCDGQIAKMMPDNVENAIGESNNDTIPNLLYQWTFSGTGSAIAPIKAPYPYEQSVITRPIFFDQNDSSYVGYEHIWEKGIGDTLWHRAFAADPIDFPDTEFAKGAIDMYMDDSNNNNVYVAYFGATSKPASDTFGTLFFSNNAKSTNPLFPPIWTNRTPSICTYDQINSIAVDPKNSSRIWVGFANINNSMVGTSPATMTNRVWYSDSAGKVGTWVDISKGLSAMPVNKLLYRKGSNDELFAGTDVGVFKWNDTTLSWQCYNNGLPPCIVMDMEINYCAGKLRVATYGRGIWETPLEDIAPLPTTVINGPGTTTWRNNMYLQTSVDIKAGAILHIVGDTIHMPKGAIFAVEPGGKLVVDDAEITNSCIQCMWQGIQAWGNNFLPQTAANQGWVVIKNGSTLSNAIMATCNYNLAVGFGSMGGIIQASNSFFIDNHNAASFEVYDNWNLALTVLSPNVSYFNNCTFGLDTNYKGDAMGLPMSNHVSLHDVEGVSFSNDVFYNRDTVLLDKGLGDGIHAVNAGFNVSGGNTSFSGFTNGIDIQGLMGYDPIISIDSASFDTVSVGVYVSGITGVSVTRGNFTVGHGRGVNDASSPSFTGCYQNIGIMMQNTAHFRMEGNNFEGKPRSIYGWDNYGAVVANSGENINTVYRNTFGDSLTMGVYAIGGNYLSGFTGLEISCDTFLENVNDLYIASDGGAYAQGIGYYQGSPGSPAGNTFYGSTQNIVNNCDLIDYFYSNPLYAADYPYYHTSGSGIVMLSPSSEENSCPSSFATTHGSSGWREGTGALDPSTLRTDEAAFRANQAVFLDSQAVYNGLIDFGNTDSLVSIIQLSNDTAALYTTLHGGKPFISETALDTVTAYMALPYYSMMQVLQQNPDDLHDNAFLTYVQAAYSLSISDMDLLAAAASNTTRRTTLEQTMGALQTTLANEGNVILMALKSASDTNVSVADTTGAGICTDSTSIYFGLDSNSVYWGLDSVDAWLQNIGGVSAQYARVGYYNFLGQYSTANRIFAGIGGTLPATGADRTEYNSYTTLWGVIYNAELAGRNIWELNLSEIAELDTSSVPVVTYNTAAQLVYNYTTGVAGSPLGGPAGPPVAPSGTPTTACYYGILDDGGRHAHPGIVAPTPSPVININDVNAPVQFSVYPNPTSGIVTFSYNVPYGGDMNITVTNIVGEEVANLHSSKRADNVYWDPKAVPAGVYLYRASNGNGMVSKGKVVVVK